MKTSWFIGLAMLYIIILIFSSIAESSNLVTASAVNDMQSLTQPTGTDVISGGYSIITKAWDYFKVVGGILFLWNPTIWSGTWYWFYLIVILPICIAMWISLVMVIRGVHSS